MKVRFSFCMCNKFKEKYASQEEDNRHLCQHMIYPSFSKNKREVHQPRQGPLTHWLFGHLKIREGCHLLRVNCHHLQKWWFWGYWALYSWAVMPNWNWRYSWFILANKDTIFFGEEVIEYNGDDVVNNTAVLEITTDMEVWWIFVQGLKFLLMANLKIWVLLPRMTRTHYHWNSISKEVEL